MEGSNALTKKIEIENGVVEIVLPIEEIDIKRKEEFYRFIARLIVDDEFLTKK